MNRRIPFTFAPLIAVALGLLVFTESLVAQAPKPPADAPPPKTATELRGPQEQNAKLFQAGLLSSRSRHAEGLTKLLVQYFDVPVRIERGKASLTASGQLTLNQTDFGITPMSVMAGAMVVQDQMALTFKIVAGPAR